MNRNTLLIVGCVSVIIIAGIAQFFFSRSDDLPSPSGSGSPFVDTSATTTLSGSITVPATDNSNSNASTVHPLPLVAGDQIVSWSFKGAYTGNPELMAKAEAEIARLSGLVGKGEYPDVTLYVGIAGQYELLGDGKQVYDYLGRAVKASETTALPWHNLGTLVERLGAYKTARVAYEKATILQPGMKSWHYAYLEFLTRRMKDGATTIEKAFAAAEANFGQDAYLLQLRSEWENS